MLVNADDTVIRISYKNYGFTCGLERIFRRLDFSENSLTIADLALTITTKLIRTFKFCISMIYPY